MEDEIFKGGVLPGAPTSEFEIKFLICYLLARAGEPVSFGQLAATFQETGLVNYFEFSYVMSELLEQGHVVQTEAEELVFSLTEHGRQADERFYKEVPLSVRERCEEQLKRQLKLSRRIRENTVSITKTQDGYSITLEIPDVGTPLVSLSMFAPTRELCESIRRRFLNDPLTFYKGVVALTTGDITSVLPLMPEAENLFE